MKKFIKFTREGQKDETSRMYISVNKRNAQKIKKELAMYLIEDVLGDRHIEVTHIESFIAGSPQKQRIEKKVNGCLILILLMELKSSQKIYMK